MKYFLYIMLATVAFTPIAHAADTTDGKSSAIAVEKILCQPAMVEHIPSSDVSYQPGVDVNGNPVAPADINAAPPSSVSTYTEVPLTIDLANRLRLSRPAEASAVVGSLKIYKDGRVLYNGQDISQQASAVCAGNTPANVSVPANAAPSHPGSDTDHILRAPDGSAARVSPMEMPEVPLPGSAAPSATTPAR